MKTMAHDRIGSVRFEDDHGIMRVATSPISKANVCPYYGREIPKHTELGLDKEKIYNLYRHPDELKKGADTFNGIPLLKEHLPVNASSPPTNSVVGSVGSSATFSDPYLTNSLSVWDEEAIKKIKDNSQRELSCGYDYDADMTPGKTPTGDKYDGVMRNIRGNHVALVPEGRAGKDVLVQDEALRKPIIEGNIMEMTAIISALRDSCPDKSDDEIRAALSAMISALNNSPEGEETPPPSELNGDEDLEEKKANEIRAGEEANKTLDKERKNGTDPSGATDEGEAEANANEIAGGEKANKTLDKERKDGTDPSGATDQKSVQMAIDKAILAERSRLAAAENARNDVRPLVGETMGLDTADAIYAYALKQRGISSAGINIAGLKALVRAEKEKIAPSRPQNSMATDSAFKNVKVPKKL
ncbi:DUF2213 domain-containing protein [Acetobacteraceae bacterium]|nr:DUF2213 domain-containing protein [Acetobacteraceae bacterium]